MDFATNLKINYMPGKSGVDPQIFSHLNALTGSILESFSLEIIVIQF